MQSAKFRVFHPTTAACFNCKQQGKSEKMYFYVGKGKKLANSAIAVGEIQIEVECTQLFLQGRW